jgi:urea transport system ATP-binding protein
MSFRGAVQPSIIKEIGRAIGYLRNKGELAILLVEQYFEFARDLADRFAVMGRGEIVMAGEKTQMDEAHVRSHLTV